MINSASRNMIKNKEGEVWKNRERSGMQPIVGEENPVTTKGKGDLSNQKFSVFLYLPYYRSLSQNHSLSTAFQDFFFSVH